MSIEPSPQKPSPPSLPRKLIGAYLRYQKEFVVQGELKGFYLARRMWTVSSLSRLGFITLLIGLWLTTTAFSNQQSGSILIIGLSMFALGWAFALTAIVNSSPIIFLIVSAYLGWYGVLIGGSLAGSIGFALPTLWMLWLGWQVMRRLDHRLDRVWSIVLCFGAAYLTYNAYGLNHLSFPFALGVAILAALYFASGEGECVTGSVLDLEQHPVGAPPNW